MPPLSVTVLLVNVVALLASSVAPMPALIWPPVKVTSFGRVQVLPAAAFKYVFCTVASCGRVTAVESLLIVTYP